MEAGREKQKANNGKEKISSEGRLQKARKMELTGRGSSDAQMTV